MTRVLWHSNAPYVSTGYGQQTALFTPLLRELGYEVAISCFYGLHGTRSEWEGIPLYPGGLNEHGNDVLGRHARDWFGEEEGLVITLTDVWVLAAEMCALLPLAAWCPVDHAPAPDRVVRWFRKSGAVPIAMSRFGEEQLRDAGLDPVYVPHGVDADLYSPGDQATARGVLGLPDHLFVAGIVAANQGKPSRKCFAEALLAWREFAEGRDDVALYLHTQLAHPRGEDLGAICRALGLQPYVVDQYKYQAGLAPESLRDTYRALNVLLNPSRGEGFGLTPLEAQACGVPVIATDFSASCEVVSEEAGWLVGGQPVWTGFNAWQATPSVAELTVALEEAYADWQNGRLTTRGEVARRHALRYEAREVLVNHWQPALTETVRRLRWAAAQPVMVRPS